MKILDTIFQNGWLYWGSIIFFVCIALLTVPKTESVTEPTLEDISICVADKTMEEIHKAVRVCEEHDHDCMVKQVYSVCGFNN
jgi:hypothetical protein